MPNTDMENTENTMLSEGTSAEEARPDEAPGAEAAPPAPKRRLPVFAFVLYGIAVAAIAVLVAARLSPAFADTFNRYIGAVVRGALAHLTGWIPFSLGEAMVIFLPIAAVFMIVRACRKYSDS